MTEKLDRFWAGVVATLLMATLTGVLMFFLLRPDHSPLLIFEPPPAAAEASGQVSISGMVANPGLYQLKPDDNIESILDAAGGSTGGPGAIRISLVVSATLADAGPQKVDLNRAEPWLLEAVPGIGPGTANAIVAYRKEHGPYRMVQDLLAVRGIGDATLVQIAPYLTVGE